MICPHEDAEVNSVQEKYKPAFQAAAARWGSIVSSDLATANKVDTTRCPQVAGFGTIDVDDIAILIGTYTDQLGGSLGAAGPCLTRGSNGLTVVGTMRFDTLDLDALLGADLLQETVTHEMGHILGIGTLWDSKALTSGTSSDPSVCGVNPRYIGVKGVAAYKALGGLEASVPLEDQFGVGSCDGHWSESIFTNELMTSRLNRGGNPLSNLSIASLEDLGYSVNYAPADVYTLSLPSAFMLQNIAPHTRSTLLRPVGRVNDLSNR